VNVPAPPNPRLVTAAVAGALATASLANLAQLPAMERHDETSYHAFVRSDSPDMARLGLDNSPTVRRRRGLYLTLERTAPGVDVIVGPGVALDRWQLLGLGRVADVIEADYDPTTFAPDLDVSSAVVADDEDGRLGPVPFTIALADDGPRTLVVRVVGERHDLIDLRLVPDDEAAAVGR
jgi:hypothetical protein